MTINLKKGERVDLTKGNPNLKKLRVGLGWDVKKFASGSDFDLDASALLLNRNKQLEGEQDIVFYNQLRHPSNAVVHSGDNRTGAGAGDDEVITVELAKVPQNIDKIAFTVTIFEASSRKQNFGMVENSFIRVVNADDNTEILKYNLGEDFSTETAVIAGEVYRHGSEWKFSAVGSGYAGGLAELIKSHGLNV